MFLIVIQSKPFSPNADLLEDQRIATDAVFTLNEFFYGRAKEWEVDRAFDDLIWLCQSVF